MGQGHSTSLGHKLGVDINHIKYHEILTIHWKFTSWTKIRHHINCNLGDMILGQDHDTSLCQFQQLCEIWLKSVKAQTWILAMSAR